MVFSHGTTAWVIFRPTLNRELLDRRKEVEVKKPSSAHALQEEIKKIWIEQVTPEYYRVL